MPRAPWHISSGTPLPNRLSAQIGLLTARRMPPSAIADLVGGGISAEDVRRYWNELELSPPASLPRGYAIVDVALASKHRTKLAAEARQRRLELPDFAGRLLSTVANDDLFGAVVDG